MGYVKVYYADIEPLKDEALFERYYRETGCDRRSKIDRMKRQADKERSLAAGILLEKVLCNEYGISKGQCLICESENGKPYLSGREDIHFNLSHSGKYVMCAVSDMPVGCDVQELESKNVQSIAGRFFHPNEARVIGDDEKMFTRIWALKESFIKATGLGMKTELSTFSVIGKDGQVLTKADVHGGAGGADDVGGAGDAGDAAGDWYLFEHIVDEEYCFASCSKGCEDEPQMINVTFMR